MAIDYGDARTGIAISDASASIVGDVRVIKETTLSSVASAISEEAKQRDVTTIVVGHPVNMNGSIGPRAEKSGQLAELIREKVNVSVVLWDERMTTMSASRILSDTGKYGKKRKNIIDAVAASLILESYLRSLRIQSQD